MKAFVLSGYGGPARAAIQDVAPPSCDADGVVIRAHAVGLNPVDYKIREGKLRTVLSYAFPLVLGNELGGEVVEVGAAVSDFKIGDQVFARVGKEKLGAFADLCCVSARFVAPAPRSVPLRQAAAVPLAGLTALQALRDELHVGPGFRLLITGGAGGVGVYAIPLAKTFGCHVTTTVSPRGETLVRSLGADATIDYTKDALTGAVEFDGALDLVGGASLTACIKRVKRGGRVVSVAGVPEPRTAKQDMQRGLLLQALFWMASLPLRALARFHGNDYRFLFMKPSGADLRYLASEIDAGRLPVTIDRTFAFVEIAEAFRYLETGRAKGKVVVTM